MATIQRQMALILCNHSHFEFRFELELSVQHTVRTVFVVRTSAQAPTQESAGRPATPKMLCIGASNRAVGFLEASSPKGTVTMIAWGNAPGIGFPVCGSPVGTRQAVVASLQDANRSTYPTWGDAPGYSCVVPLAHTWRAQFHLKTKLEM